MAGGPDQPGPDDVRFDDVPDPDLEALARAMAGKQGDPTLGYPGAFVSVRAVQPQAWNEPGLPFFYCFGDAQQLVGYGVASRQSGQLEAAPLWLVHVVGAYEAGRAGGLGRGDDADPCPHDPDHDPDGEAWMLGITVWPKSPQEPERETSFVFVETARDLSVTAGLLVNDAISHATAHEVGHQFGLNQRPRDAQTHLMDSYDVFLGRAAWRWREHDIRQIRTTKTP